MLTIRPVARAIRLLAITMVCVPGAPIFPVPPTVDAQQAGGGECMACHLTLDQDHLVEPATDWEIDVHNLAGLTCTGCHGGDARAPVEGVAHAGMLARPPRSRTPELCGRCHSNEEFMEGYAPDLPTDQVEVYYTSRHGERVRQGDSRVATCVDCHSTHSIQPSSEPTSTTHPTNLPDQCGTCHADEERMAPYDVPTTQLDDYKSSIHWENLVEAGDLSSPVCNDCHGGHGPLSPEPGAAGRMCGECHFQIAEYFASSPHDSLFVSTDRPGCATCHGNHDIRAVDEESLTLGGRNACTEAGCHTGSDAGGVAAAAIGVLFDSLMSAHTRSDSILDAAERAGMLVDQARFELAQVQTAIVGVRALVHTVRLDSVRGKVEEGLVIADAGFVAGEDAFVELRTRRTGLAVSAAVILVLVVGLLIRIRELGVE